MRLPQLKNFPELLFGGAESDQVAAQPLRGLGRAQFVFLALFRGEQLVQDFFFVLLYLFQTLQIERLTALGLIENALLQPFNLIAQGQQLIPFVGRDKAQPALVLVVIDKIFIDLAFVINTQQITQHAGHFFVDLADRSIHPVPLPACFAELTGYVRPGWLIGLPR